MGEPRNARVAGVALAVGLAIAVASSALAGPGDTKLVSRQSKSAGGLGGDDPSRAPALSANGRYVAFQTEAGNLGGPIAGPVNIYVYDRKRKRAELVSRQSRSDGGAGADGGSYQPSISGSGRYVAFRSDADNLGGPIAANSNIYVYDRERHKVQLVSRRSRSGGGAGANGNSEDPVISANGRIVAFQTLATNLQGPLNTSINTYVYDLERKRVELVSRQSKSHGGEGQDDAYFDDYPASLSATGRFVAWTTPADNLGGPGVTDVRKIYVYDRKRKKVELVSRRSKADGGEGSLGGADAAAISGDGRFVAFQVQGELGGPANNVGNVYVYDRRRKRVSLVSRKSKSAGGGGGIYASGDPDVSADGHLIAFTAFDDFGGPATSSVYNIYVYDLEKKRQYLASRQSRSDGGAGADGFSDSASISADGRLIAFDSSSTNLSGAAAAITDVYVHQRPR